MHIHALEETFSTVSDLNLGHVTACDIDCALFYFTVIVCLCIFLPHWPPDWVSQLVLTPHSPHAVCFVSYALLRGNSTYLWCDGSHWSSNKPPVVASDCCLHCLPIIFLAPNTKHRGRETVFIEMKRESNQKEPKERVIGSTEQRFFSPVVWRRFHWKTIAVYRSTLRDRYCEVKNGEEGGGICAMRETQMQNSIQLW